MPLAEPQPRADIAAGTYEGSVINVEPDIIVPRQGRNAGKDVPVLRWTFYLPDVGEEVESITGRDPTSEKSNLFKYFVALLGSNREFWLRAETTDLIGKACLVTVGMNDEGYPRVDGVVAKPVARAAAPTPSPTAPVTVPAAAQAPLTPSEASDGSSDLSQDDLPF